VIADTAARLRSVAEASVDAGGYFAALYTQVTEQVADSIDSGRFSDGPRMDAFATTFAGYYLRSGEDPPRCWQACQDVAGDRSLLIVQHLLLGINAHVNHDLPLAVVDTAGDGDLAAVRGDFDAVNDVLADAYGDVLDSLGRVSRWVNHAAGLGGGRLFNFSLRTARQQAWAAAERLHRLDGAHAREQYRLQLDDLVSVVAYLITRPPAPSRPLLWMARRLEEQHPLTVTAALLAPR
jgi:hypothetical protein